MLVASLLVKTAGPANQDLRRNDIGVCVLLIDGRGAIVHRVREHERYPHFSSQSVLLRR